MIPRSYRGIIQACSHQKGKITFLPELSQDMRVTLEKQEEMVVLVGGPSAFSYPEASPSELEKHRQEASLDDFCQLDSQKGTIYVGYVGEQIPERPKGFFQRLRTRQSQAHIA
jgi:hypothetical protein